MAFLCLLRHPVFFHIFLLITMPIMAHSLMNDADALLRIKLSLNNPQALDSWKLGTKPCDEVIRWVGLVCSHGFVNSLRLRSMNLSGNIDLSAMSQMQGLRILSLENNSFSGPIPDFNKLGALKALYLSNNRFSGEIPPDYFAKMASLKKIWLDGNNFTGQIPSSIAQLPRLLELHLENNRFSGTIPSFGQQSLESLNLSRNSLTGEVPTSLSRFDAASFEGNPGLCGAKFGKVCEKSPAPSPGPTEETHHHHHHESLKVAYMLMVLSAIILLLMLIGIYVLMKKTHNDPETYEITKKENFDGSIGLTISSVDKKPDVPQLKSSGSSRKGVLKKNKEGGGDLVLLNEDKGVFGLSDLMTAAAEVLGNGSSGSSYKATMSGGMIVVVKRLKDMNKLDKDGFKAETTRLGKLHHPNVLAPMACHYRKEEKLLIYEYIPKGSLLYLLHGDHGASDGPFSWPTRLKIIKGIARGMDYIHTELATLEMPHGNLKSSNVLLSLDYEPLVVDYGLISMIDINKVASVLAGYKAPEAAQSRSVSAKCDVYCLGIVILEILTRKFPSQYLNNGKGGTDVVQWIRSAILEQREGELLDPEITGSTASVVEMQKLLYIGAACTESNHQKRLDIRDAVRRIQEIQVEGNGDDIAYQMPPSL